MVNKRSRSFKKAATNTGALRERVIVQYHELLRSDTTIAPRVFERLHDAMRENRLTYGDRPISVALRPHFLEYSQFEIHTALAGSIASTLEKVAAAAMQSPTLMAYLGLTDAEQKAACIDPGFTATAVTRDSTASFSDNRSNLSVQPFYTCRQPELSC